jgi:hypothetical protein
VLHRNTENDRSSEISRRVLTNETPCVILNPVANQARELSNMSYTIQDLAKDCNVTERDAAGFIAALRIWTAKGYTVEQAIEKHMAQMVRFVNHSVQLASDPSIRRAAANAVWDEAHA